MQRVLDILDQIERELCARQWPVVENEINRIRKHVSRACAHSRAAPAAELFNEMPLCPCGCGSRGHLTKAL